MNIKSKLLISGLSMIVLMSILTLSSVAMAQKVLKIGVLGPMTGANSRGGDEIKAGVITAFEENKNKIGDYRVEFVWIDSQATPAKAVTAYEEAVIKNKIDCGLGNWYSPVVLACMDVMARYKVPHFFGCAAAKSINDKFRSDVGKYGYLMAKSWPEAKTIKKPYVLALEDAIKRGLWKPQNKKAVICIEDTDFARDAMVIFEKDFKEYGWEIVSKEIINPGEMDVYPVILKMKKENPAVIVGSISTPALSTTLVKQMRELDVKSVVLMDGLGWVGEWYKLTGNTSNYVLDQQAVVSSPKVQAFVDDFTKRWKFEPSLAVSILHYDAAKLLIKLLNYANDNYGGLNKETIYRVGKEQLWTGNISHQGIFMNFKYSKESIPDPITGLGYWILPIVQYFDGKSIIVYPANIKTSDLKIR